MVVLLLLVARSFSHCVQFIERYYEIYEETGDRNRSAELALRVLMAPESSIVTDATGLFLIAIARFQWSDLLCFAVFGRYPSTSKFVSFSDFIIVFSRTKKRQISSGKEAGKSFTNSCWLTRNLSYLSFENPRVYGYYLDSNRAMPLHFPQIRVVTLLRANPLWE